MSASDDKRTRVRTGVKLAGYPGTSGPSRHRKLDLYGGVGSGTGYIAVFLTEGHTTVSFHLTPTEAEQVGETMFRTAAEVRERVEEWKAHQK